MMWVVTVTAGVLTYLAATDLMEEVHPSVGDVVVVLVFAVITLVGLILAGRKRPAR